MERRKFIESLTACCLGFIIVIPSWFKPKRRGPEPPPVGPGPKPGPGRPEPKPDPKPRPGRPGRP